MLSGETSNLLEKVGKMGRINGSSLKLSAVKTSINWGLIETVKNSSDKGGLHFCIEIGSLTHNPVGDLVYALGSSQLVGGF